MNHETEEVADYRAIEYDPSYKRYWMPYCGMCGIPIYVALGAEPLCESCGGLGKFRIVEGWTKQLPPDPAASRTANPPEEGPRSNFLFCPFCGHAYEMLRSPVCFVCLQRPLGEPLLRLRPTHLTPDEHTLDAAKATLFFREWGEDKSTMRNFAYAVHQCIKNDEHNLSESYKAEVPRKLRQMRFWPKKYGNP